MEEKSEFWKFWARTYSYLGKNECGSRLHVRLLLFKIFIWKEFIVNEYKSTDLVMNYSDLSD